MSRLDDLDMDEKRLARRQKRRKSQITAYIFLAVFLVLIGVGVFFTINSINGFLKEKAQEKEAQIAAAQEASIEAQNTVVETPTEMQEEPMTEEDLLDQIITTCIGEMPIEDKVAGLFIITPEQLTGVDTAVKAGSGTQEALSTYAVGGVVYSSKNIKSAEQIQEMLSTTASMSKYPIFTVVSEDGTSQGSVSSTIGIDEIAEMTDAESASSYGGAIGNSLFKYGFNFCLTPVSFSEDSIWGNDIDSIKGLTASFAEGMKETGVLSCMNAFPMLSDTKEAMEVNETTREDIESQSYVIYRNAIESGSLNAIMLSNGSYPGLTGDNTPASLSKVVVEDDLRGSLGFNGIVVTGALNEGAITEYYTPDQAAIAAVKAGADMIYLPEDFKEAYDGLLAAVQAGEISEDRINESLVRIYRVKYADKVNQIKEDN